MTNKKRIKLVEIIKISGNSFGDQIIELKVDGELQTYSNQEGDHVDVHSWINRTFKPIAIESTGSNALNRIFG
jgi:hypothetical protein